MNDELRAQVERARMAQAIDQSHRHHHRGDIGMHLFSKGTPVPYVLPLALPIGVGAILVYLGVPIVKASIVVLICMVVVAPIAIKKLIGKQ